MRERRRLRGGLCALLMALTLPACGPTRLRDLTLRPEKYYQEKISVTGRITRMQVVGGDTLLEIADRNENRLLVRTSAPVPAGVGEWVRAKGVLVPEARVNDATLYDVLSAEEISATRGPWLPRIM